LRHSNHGFANYFFAGGFLGRFAAVEAQFDVSCFKAARDRRKAHPLCVKVFDSKKIDRFGERADYITVPADEAKTGRKQPDASS
jgi:hypothetical protein